MKSLNRDSKHVSNGLNCGETLATRRWKIGIVGGSGFIGYSLAKYLSNEYDVRILDVVPPPSKGRFEFQKCDIRNYEEVKSHMDGLEFAIHSAIIQIPLITERKKFGYEVNFIGTQNVCKVVDELASFKGMILTSSWHTIGERELSGIVDEEFGFRPDKVEDRARLYALSKMAQEAIMRFYDEMSQKIYGIIRMGTVLGQGMPEKTAANIFIERGLRGESLTPYKHSMYRPMLYVDIDDVCKAYELYVRKVLTGQITKTGNSLDRIVNVYYPEPITIIELAEMVRDTVIKRTNGRIKPNIEIVDKGEPPLFSEEDHEKMRIDTSKAKKLLGIDHFLNPRESIERILEKKLKT